MLQVDMFGATAAPAERSRTIAYGDDGVERWATISACGAYRYELGRRWAEGPADLWVMLNPSTADGEVDDPTLKRIMGFSRRWGSGGLVVVNLFALRSSDPRALLAHADPVGPENDVTINVARRAAIFGGRVIAAWGSSVPFELPTMLRRDQRVLEILRPHSEVLCLGRTASGAPTHPLARGKNRVPDDRQPEPFAPGRSSDR